MGRPMPTELRRWMRSRQHPARAVACPHCGASEHRPCRSQSHARTLPDPHPSRIAAWATATAVCPACQVDLGMPCYLDGRPLTGGHVHPAREEEARRTTA